MKKFLSIPFVCALVSLMTFFGYSFFDDPADYNANNDKTVPPVYDYNSGTTATWTTLTSSPHAQSRSCLAWVTIAGVDYIYQFGGGGGAALMNVARYNINTSTWTNNYSTMPASISSGSAVVVDDSLLYVFGGNSPTLGITLKYNYITDTWTTMAPMPTPVTDALVVKYTNNLIYLIGGGTGLFGTGYFNNVQLYNVSTNSYSLATAYPVAAGMMGGGIYGDTIISAGGWNGTAGIANAYKGIINSGNPANITWTPIADYPGGNVTRMASAFVKLGTGGGIMFAGGAIGGSTLTATSYLWNMCTNTWENLPNISQARSNFKGASKDGATAYVCGGFTTVGVGTFERVDFSDITGNCFTAGGNSVTVCRDGLNKPIPDNGGNGNPVRDTIVISGVPAGMEITRVTVTIDSVLHTWTGDLRFWLVKDNSIGDTIISRIGLGTGAFPGAGNSCNDFIGTNLVDTAAALIQGLQDPSPGCGNGPGTLPASGYFKPKDPLSVFENDEDPNGTYILSISDNAALDVGSLRSWCLTIEYDMLTHSGNNTAIVNDFKLYQNYPNPFNPATKIKFEIPKQNFVTLKIYDIAGREVASLVNGIRTAGAYEVEFDGSYLASGTYFYRIQAGDFVEVKKMVLLK